MVPEVRLISIMNTLRIGGIVPLSIIDWRGAVAYMVFFAGCNFSCPYCHNYELIPRDSGSPMTMAEIEEDLLSRRITGDNWLIDTVGASGGEPTLQEVGLQKLFQLARKYDLKTLVETNGSRPEVLKKLIDDKLIDYVALDFKTTPEKYYLVGGEAPIKSLAILEESEVEWEIRTTMDPMVVDEGDLISMARLFPPDYRWIKQPLRNT